MVDLNGLLVPLVTPFTDDASSLSEVRLAKLTRQMACSNVGGFLVGSELGEFPALGIGERKAALEIIVRESQSVPGVVQNITTLSTSGCIDLAQHAKRHGARAALVIPPFFGMLRHDELFGHFQTISNFAELPLIVLDPEARLSPELQNEISALRGVQFAESTLGVFEQFSFGECWCNPLAGCFEPEVLRRVLGSKHRIVLESLFARTSSAGLAKSALMLQDIEIGPLRAPLRALAGPDFELMRNCITALQGEASEEEPESLSPPTPFE